MAAKEPDRAGRIRNKTVAFRVSKEEAEMINRFVKVSGMTKQDYIINRLSNRDIVVEGSIRTFNGLKDQLKYVQEELKRISVINPEHMELFELISVITEILFKIEENQSIAEKRRLKTYKKRGRWSNV